MEFLSFVLGTGGGYTGLTCFELIHRRSLMNSSEQPICVRSWPHLLSRASHSTKPASWHQKRKQEETQRGLQAFPSILGNRGGAHQAWFSEEQPPAQAAVKGEAALTVAPSGLGPGEPLTEGTWRVQSTLVS